MECHEIRVFAPRFRALLHPGYSIALLNAIQDVYLDKMVTVA